MLLEIYDKNKRRITRSAECTSLERRCLASAVYRNSDFLFLFITRGARYEKQMAASSRVPLLPIPEFQQNKEKENKPESHFIFPFLCERIQGYSRLKIFLSFILLMINAKFVTCDSHIYVMESDGTDV